MALDPTIAAKVQAWLNGPYDQESKAEVQALLDAGNETELVDSFYRNLEFGTGGLRGTMGPGTNRMNRYTVAMATQGLANYLLQVYPNQQASVAIAHDSRNNSDVFTNVCADVLSANGIMVYLFPALRPTPLLSYAVRYFNAQSGIVLTASHNPKEYNGYKCYWSDGAQLIPPHDKNVVAEADKITDFNQVKMTRNAALVQVVDAAVEEAYLRDSASLSVDPAMVARQSNLKIVYTPIHGTGITMVPRLLERFGFNNVHIVEAQAMPDGNFPTAPFPNPEEAAAMQLGLQEAEKLDADILLGTDPDADRVGIAVKNPEGKWTLLNGNQTASLLVYYMLEAWKKAGKLQGKEMVIKTIVTTDLLDSMAAKYGVKCFNTLTGFKYIAGLINQYEGELQFIVGGEESYGYLVGDFVRDKDAVISAAMISEVAAYAKDQGLSLFSLLEEIYKSFNMYKEHLISVTKKGKSGAEEIQEMMAGYRQSPPTSLGGSVVVQLLDYQSQQGRDLKTGATWPLGTDKSNVLQFVTADGSKISARPSGTEPKIKFYFSVNTPYGGGNFDSTIATLDAKIAIITKDLGF